VAEGYLKGWHDTIYELPEVAATWTGLGRRKGHMGGLLALSRGIDWATEKLGIVANWLVLLTCLISAGNAFSRYLFSISSNAWLEIQWYMFAGMVLLGAPHVLRVNEHVRVDLVYGSVGDRTRLWIDLFGAIFFLLPICILLVYFTWPWFLASYYGGEMSSNAGGLIRWPVKLILPVGFAILAIQGVSEIIKMIAALRGLIVPQHRYQAPLQ
jgi:TRAP-type mannitol/chloroaromatic compound transport system permease small subunit